MKRSVKLSWFSFAGSDTTAISLRSMFYYLCKNRRCYDELLKEIDDLDRQQKLSDPVTFAEANQMPYLQACMKEAMRIHPAVGQLLERVVPKGGAEIEGIFLPEGTIIGVNPWVPSRDRSTYGTDADIYRPERWLEADEERLKLMERNFLAVRLASPKISQSLADIVHDSLDLAHELALERMCRSSRCRSWCRNCYADITLS